MIEKKEDTDLINGEEDEPITLDEDPMLLVSSNDITAVVLAESRLYLEQMTLRVQDDIAKSFARLNEALKSREKQLLRQVDVLHSQQLALLQSNQSPHLEAKTARDKNMPVSVDLNDENDLIESVLAFGKVSLVASEGNTSPYYKLEDYQDAAHDHMCLYKPLSEESTPQHQVIKFGFAPKLTPRSEEETNNNYDASEPKSEDTSESDKPDVQERRPSQVQQWLQQIMVETETEPTVGEVQKNFDPMSQSHSFD